MKKKVYTNKFIVKVLKDYLKTRNATQTAPKFGLPPMTVGRWVHEAKIKESENTVNKGTRWDEIRKELGDRLTL